MLNQLSLPLNLSVRASGNRDQSFFKALFRAARPHLECPDLPAVIVTSLIDQQYELQQAHYRAHWPTHSNWVIERYSQAVGGVTLDHNQDKIHLLNLVIHPEHQSQKVGTSILESIQRLATASNRTIQLSVDRQNTRAQRLYLALGFRSINKAETHESMTWKPLCMAAPE